MKKILFFLFTISFFNNISIKAYPESNDSIEISKILKLAKKYRYGINTEVNTKKAILLYKMLTHHNNPIAMRELANIYLRGDGVKKNYDIAYKLLYKASDLGDTESLCTIADMYREGKGVQLDYNKAFNLYKKAAESGNAHGLYGVGYAYFKGMGVNQDYKNAIKYLAMGAEKGHSGCELLLANYYSHGYIDNCPNYEKAKNFYLMAIKHGNNWVLDIIKLKVIDSVKNVRKKQETIWKQLNGKCSLEYINKEPRYLYDKFTNNITGTYTGKLYTYDWSGKYVEKEEDITINLLIQDTKLSFICYIKDSIYTSYSSDEYNNIWIKNKIDQTDLKYTYLPINVSIQDLSSDTFSLSMDGINPRNKEKKRPLLAILSRNVQTNNISETKKSHEIDVKLIGQEIVVMSYSTYNEKLSIVLYTIDGREIINLANKNIIKGKNLFFVNTKLEHGTYILKINGKEHNFSKTIIYEQ